MRALIVGGGTGGHVIPALAIARELKARHAAELLFVGTARGIETRLVPAAGFELKLIHVGQLKNVSLRTRLRTLFDLPLAILAARKLMREFKPDVVIGVGGYASGPGMLAAILGGLPTLAFEPNVVPGFANRVVARFVKAAAVHFQETKDFFPGACTKITGVPVREEFFKIAPRSLGSKNLLVFGGSQGSRALNRVMREALPALIRRVPEIKIVHQTGERDFENVQQAYEKAGVSAQVSKFIDNMPQAFAEADLVLCRSGASTVAEITAAGRPAIFVPFPQAADDHQRRNAEALVKANAAELIPEPELSVERLVDIISNAFSDRARLQQMAQNARALSHPRAATEIAEMAAELVEVNDALTTETQRHRENKS
jgi:UDP-N-acetylglucosamine--N-acetylmuramyl-(pentapeptide) pyrophosphoryl-undecaprenol N-acetylglucosamine transferase